MFGSASLFRLGGVVAAGAVVAAVAGCSSGGSSSAPPSSPASSASSASSSSAPSSPAPSSAPSSSAAAPSGSQSPHAVAGSSPAQSAPAGPVGCATRDLQAKLANGQGAAGSLYQNIDFTNVGSTQCSLFGYPGVSIGTGMPFKQVGTAATRSTAASATVVTLAPGQTANALLRVTQALNYPSAKCSPAKTTYLQVYPPNQTTAIYVAYSSTGCTSTSVNLLTIGVVQAGAGSQ